MSKIFYKPPGATLDYWIDWSDALKLSGAAVSSSSWIAESGIAVNTSIVGITGDLTFAAVYGGTLGEVYEIENNVTFSNGETDRRVIVIEIADHIVTHEAAVGQRYNMETSIEKRRPRESSLNSVSWTVPAGLTFYSDKSGGDTIAADLGFDTVGDYEIQALINYTNGLIDVILFSLKVIDES